MENLKMPLKTIDLGLMLRNSRRGVEGHGSVSNPSMMIYTVGGICRCGKIKKKIEDNTKGNIQRRGGSEETT